MNLLLWGTDMDERMFPTLDLIQEIGFRGVEVPIFSTNPTDWIPWRKRLDALGLYREADTFCGPEVNLISTDKVVRETAVEHLKRCVDCAVVIGATKLMGPYHSALGVFTGQPPTPDEWKWGVEGIQRLADYAQTQGITLGLEYLNRFELYLTSSASELMRFVDDVAHSHCQIMFDTFHANIEEKHIGESLRQLGERVVFIQLSENDRSTPGKGHVDWNGTFGAIRDMGYSGWLSIEAFGPALPAANIWRKMYTSEEQLMREGLAFIQQKSLEFQLPNS